MLLRKFGLATDNVIDAHLIDDLTLMVEFLTENPWGRICFGPLEEVVTLALESLLHGK